MADIDRGSGVGVQNRLGNDAADGGGGRVADEEGEVLDVGHAGGEVEGEGGVLALEPGGCVEGADVPGLVMLEGWNLRLGRGLPGGRAGSGRTVNEILDAEVNACGCGLGQGLDRQRGQSEGVDAGGLGAGHGSGGEDGRDGSEGLHFNGCWLLRWCFECWRLDAGWD